ncbi:ribonuclease E/G, partial [Methylobacterium sp. WL120]
RGRAEGRGRDGGDAVASEGAASDFDASQEAGVDPVAELQPEQPVSAEAVEAAIAAATPPAETAIDLPVSSPAETSSPDAPAPSPVATEAAPEPMVEPASPAPAPVRAPEPVAVVLSEPSDPDRPKRAGWWSRTKAALTGE